MNNSRIEVTVRVQVWTGGDVGPDGDGGPDRKCDMTASSEVARVYGGVKPGDIADHARCILSDINRVLPEKLKEEAYAIARSIRSED